MAFDESTRSLNIKTPRGVNDVQLTAFSGEEPLSGLFHFELTLVSVHADIPGDAMVGKRVTFSIDHDDGDKRFFNGYVNRFSGGDEDVKGQRTYHASVVPWLWFLDKTADCRIFQEKTIIEIIEQVFTDLGFMDYEMKISGDHPVREYCVQYRETDFEFVTRLLEEEGVYYHFNHEDDKHTMVMSDSTNGYTDVKESRVDYPHDISATRGIGPTLRSWQHVYEFRTGAWAHTDYDFKAPRNNLMSTDKTVMTYEKAKSYEKYDYPGEFRDKGLGKTLSRVRMEELEAGHDLVYASSNCKSFTSAGRFYVARHRVRAEEDKEYVITNIRHEARATNYETGESDADVDEYTNQFECIPSSTVYRPPRTTTKPIMRGCQTAVVTGPPGEEIYPDEFGRVKVQFHWDREGKRDQDSSCWIRCKQSVAGNKWGFMALPRIGQEVVVDFLEGDPDYPLITGCVYNADQMPHYVLPDEKTKTYIKTNSSKGGDGHNELMFEDKAGDERVYIHAQKNMDVRVLNDSKTRIFGNRHQIIGWEKDGQKGGDQKELVYQDKHLNIKRHQVEHIEGNMQLTIGEGDADDGGNLDVLIEKDKKEHVKGDSHLTVDGAVNQKFEGGLSQTIGGNSLMKVDGNIAQESGPTGEIHLKAGMKVIIEAGVQISLVGPGGFIDIGPAGVSISGLMVNINSGGAAGSGSGCSPAAAQVPQKAAPASPAAAHSSTSGMVSTVGGV
ncbi:MAG: type VI secretion system tip protein TssI/VgrG [Pirellulaceae bacterium]